jgi:hypothetical protein
MHNYKLNGHEPIACEDFREWAEWFETADCHVAKTQVAPEVFISTVFLGMDHRFMDDGPPVLFETMVFRGGNGEEQERYCTWNEAEVGHAMMVKRVQDELACRS